jgi:hypothetical protein
VLPNDKEFAALVRELQEFELRASASGMTSGAFRTGSHDDLAVALGLACLFDPSGQRVRYFPACTRAGPRNATASARSALVRSHLSRAPRHAAGTAIMFGASRRSRDSWN